MNVRMPLEQLRQMHPMPWRTVVAPPNRVMVVDASNQEVPLFVLTGFVTDVTERVASQQQPQPQEQPAP